MLVNSVEIDMALNTYSSMYKQGLVKAIDYNNWRRLVALSSKKAIFLTTDDISKGDITFTFTDTKSGELLNFNFHDISAFIALLQRIHTRPTESEKQHIQFLTNSISSGSIATQKEINEAIDRVSPYITTTGIAAKEVGKAIENLTDTVKDWTTTNKKYVKEFNATQEFLNKTLNMKEDKDMDTNMFGNLEFGSCEYNNIKMSPYGLAIKNKDNNYVAYSAADGKIMNVNILNFDCGKYIYKMPVATSAVKVGDCIIHNRVSMFVTEVNDTNFTVVDPYEGEVKQIIPMTSPFGFNFVTKVVSLFDFTGAKADAEHPFGNMLPMLLMANGSDKIDPMIFMLGAQNGMNFADNPMMLYALMGGDKMKDILPLLFLSGNNPFGNAQVGAHAKK